jgi:hypothetical protein
MNKIDKRLLDLTSRNSDVGQVAQEKLVDVRGEGAIHLMGVNTKGIAQYKKYMLHPTWQQSFSSITVSEVTTRVVDYLF